MANRGDWDFALRIRGASPKTLPLADLADYLKEFAGLIGDAASPVFAGIVNGSAVLRAKQREDHPTVTKHRIQAAANDPVSAAGRSVQRLNQMLVKDRLSAVVLDRSEKVVIELEGFRKAVPETPTITVFDHGHLDGSVISVVGSDDTIHVRLADIGGIEHKVTVRDIEVAQELAKRFRGSPVRIAVHGTWRRTDSGRWEPHQVYADSFEDLSNESIVQIFAPLKAMSESGWSKSEDPAGDWEAIRGLDDLHA